ncbi:MAG TPA: TetR family transcriptional regulator [Thermoanaerobaculia bacterium]|nr:TetR family transcriptional regulator [Thermoanaerobaculia bacterium]
MATRADWEQKALSEVAAGGLARLAIPALARSLGVTKGSFYWHFQNLRQLVGSALRRWEEMDRDALDEVHEIADPRRRLIALFRDAMHKRQAHALYVALSAADAAEVRSSLRRINRRRLRFLIEAYRELGFPPKKARDRATLAYAAYVGALHLRYQNSGALRRNDDLDGFVAHSVETLIP